MSKILGPVALWTVVIYLLYVLWCRLAGLGPGVWQKLESVFIGIVAGVLVIVAFYGSRQT